MNDGALETLAEDSVGVGATVGAGVEGGGVVAGVLVSGVVDGGVLV